MPTKKEMKDARLLLSHFDKKYEETHNQKYIGNSHSDVWGFRSMIDDLGFDVAFDVVTYYFKTNPQRGHTRDHLLYNYHLYYDAVQARRRQRSADRALLQKMKEDFGEG